MKGTSTYHKSGFRLKEVENDEQHEQSEFQNYHISQICVAHLSIFATACKKTQSRHRTKSCHSSVWRFSPSSPASILSRSILFSFSITPSSWNLRSIKLWFKKMKENYAWNPTPWLPQVWQLTSYCVKNQRCSGSSGLHGFNQNFSGVLVT